ncbi:MAG: hypothetical protein R2939_08495 [Kofleriaceae bacterium]
MSLRSVATTPGALTLALVGAFACGNLPKGGEIVDAGDGGDGDGGDRPDAAVCMTSLCGDPVICCDDGTECVADACQPACDSGVRCGVDLLTCCDAGDVCLSGSSANPLGQCLPQPDPLTCEYQPVFDTLNVTTEVVVHRAHQIISIPLVANLDNASAPEVVIIA